MRKRLILLLSMLLVLGSFTTGFAAENQTDKPDNIITLEQVKRLVKENSRSLKKYEIAVDKAKYQQQQADDEEDDLYLRYNSLSNQYGSLSEQYNQLLESGKTAEAEAIRVQMEQVERDMESQYDKIDSSSNSIKNAEDNYDDAVKEQENYWKQLDYIVEELYINILNQEESLRSLQKEYELKKYLLTIERKKLDLGRTSQTNVDKISTDVTNLNKQLTEQTNTIRLKKGQLNDMMGKGYDDPLKMTSIEVSVNVIFPEYQALLSSATQGYDLLWQLRREIDDLEDENDDEDDYYTSRLLDLGIQEKELQLADEKNKLNELVSNVITDLKAKQDNYKIALADYAQAQKKYDWDKKRFELGQISKTTLLQSELNYINTGNKKAGAKHDLYLAQRSVELAKDGIF